MSLGPVQNARSLEITLNAMPIGVSWATLSDQKIIFMNRKFTEMFGYVVGDFPAINDWIDHYPFEEDRVLASARWGAFFTAPTSDEFLVEAFELSIRCKDGTIKTILHHGVILPDVGWAVATFIDISDRKRDEVSLREAARQARESQAIYHTLLDNAPEMIVLRPFDKSSRYVSPAVFQVTGFTPDEYLAFEHAQLFHPEDLVATNAVIAALRGGATNQSIRHRMAHKDGTYRWVETTATAYVDPETDKTAGYVATIRDISGEIEKEEAAASERRLLQQVAAIDELTGIANRRTFNFALTREAARLTRSASELTLLIIDVDHFKLYNDRYGHLEGDACLRAVAQTIQHTIGRANDLAARFGGEEFVVLAPMTTCAGANTLARRILAAVASLELPHAGSQQSIVTVSIGGTSVAAGTGIDEATLIERADRALYLAKAEGRNAFVYLPFTPAET